MTDGRCRIRWIVLAFALSLSWAGWADDGQPGPLRILLTNDDGYDAPGAMAVRNALLAAGHSVTVVAPREQQSGSSVRITLSGSLSYTRHSEDIWSVDGTPADAVLVALLYIMRDDPPDLVVSGANFGQNLGSNANSSGTVGAALMAMQEGIPAIAVSVGMNLEEREALPTPFPSTMAAFEPAADFTADLIRRLQENGGGRLIPEHTVLNVNYPALASAEVQGVRFTPVARVGAFRMLYRDSGKPGELRLEPRHVTGAGQEADTDTDLFARAYITISVLDGNWDADETRRKSVAERYSGMRTAK